MIISGYICIVCFAVRCSVLISVIFDGIIDYCVILIISRCSNFALAIRLTVRRILFFSIGRFHSVCLISIINHITFNIISWSRYCFLIITVTAVAVFSICFNLFCLLLFSGIRLLFGITRISRNNFFLFVSLIRRCFLITSRLIVHRGCQNMSIITDHGSCRNYSVSTTGGPTVRCTASSIPLVRRRIGTALAII